VALPLGCHWAGGRRHPLEERIGLLGARPPGERRLALGRAAVVVLVLAAGGGAWGLKPVDLVAAHAAAPARAAAPTMLFLIYR
jgi:beta-lactamase regulating signal transducer with metallopeptidase domain